MVMNGAVETPALPTNTDGFRVDRNGGLTKVNTVWTGKTSLMHNAMSSDDLLSLWDKKKKAKTAARPEPREWAESKLHKLHDGTPCIPANAVYGCLINAGQFIRMDGKRQVSTAKSTNLPGMLTLESDEFPIFLPGTDTPATWEVDLRQGRNPNGGEAVCIIRPRFDAWSIHVPIIVDQSQMSLSTARELVEVAGNRVGLLEFRPNRKGVHGRFGITAWEIDAS